MLALLQMLPPVPVPAPAAALQPVLLVATLARLPPPPPHEEAAAALMAPAVTPGAPGAPGEAAPQARLGLDRLLLLLQLALAAAMMLPLLPPLLGTAAATELPGAVVGASAWDAAPQSWPLATSWGGDLDLAFGLKAADSPLLLAMRSAPPSAYHAW